MVASVGAVAMAIAGCGPSSGGTTPPGAGSGPPNARHVDSLSSPPRQSANDAALGFGAYYEDEDAADCGHPSDFVDGFVTNRIWDRYSCLDVMTPRDVKWRCHNGAGGGGGMDERVRTVARRPLTKRIGPMIWGVRRICPGHGSHDEGGHYEVTVTKLPIGWIVTGFKTLSGPGAGTQVQ